MIQNKNVLIVGQNVARNTTRKYFGDLRLPQTNFSPHLSAKYNHQSGSSFGIKIRLSVAKLSQGSILGIGLFKTNRCL